VEVDMLLNHCVALFMHYKTHVSPVSTCLEWGHPLLAVGDLKMRESNTRSKAPILALPEILNY